MNKAPRVAVHDFLTQQGGAERVALHLCRAFREPTLVTSVYCAQTTYPEFAALDVRANKLVTTGQARRFRLHALSYPAMFRAVDLSEFDYVVISSSAFAHHVRHPRTIVYWHTPPRFLYDSGAYFPRPVASLASGVTGVLRSRDHTAAVRHGFHLANSARTAGRLAQAYGIKAGVLHPPLDVANWEIPLTDRPVQPQALVVSRLLPYKRVELAIRACAQAGLPLTVVGQGPELARLASVAHGSATRFVSSISDAELQMEYMRASVVICPAAEDFGYVPVEAAYAGRPVVASRAGGAAESVLDGRTGFLLDGWDVAEWADAIRRSLDRPWSAPLLREHAASFSGESFDGRLFDAMAPLAGSDLVHAWR